MQLGQTEHENVFVSVIIPVFNDSERLRLCLQALEHQTYPKDAYEIIIVDNNSTEDIQAIVAEFAQASITSESRQGSYVSRNKGISIAKGNILAFTDSDCIPASNWIEKGIEYLWSKNNCGLVGGNIAFYFKKTAHPTAAELYDSHNSLQQKNYIEEKKYGATANVFTFRHIFESVGLFNADLQSGGDHEWGNRVFAAGYALEYGEDVKIQHPARSLEELTTKVNRITKGHFILEKQSEKPLGIFAKELYLDFKPSIKFVLKILADPEIGSVVQRVNYIYVYSYLRFVRALKKANLYIGYKYQKKKKPH